MFQTLQPDSFRINKTAFPATRRKLHLNLSSDSDERPSTTAVTSNSCHNNPIPHSLRTIGEAEFELTNSFKN